MGDHGEGGVKVVGGGGGGGGGGAVTTVNDGNATKPTATNPAVAAVSELQQQQQQQQTSPPKKNSGGGGVIAVVVLVALVLAGGGAYVFHRYKQKGREVAFMAGLGIANKEATLRRKPPTQQPAAGAEGAVGSGDGIPSSAAIAIGGGAGHGMDVVDWEEKQATLKAGHISNVL